MPWATLTGDTAKLGVQRRDWHPTDFADFFPPAKVGPGSDSYDSTITDFEAERVAAEMTGIDEGAWEGLVRFIEGREIETARGGESSCHQP